jgi:hypothetical protein
MWEETKGLDVEPHRHFLVPFVLCKFVGGGNETGLTGASSVPQTIGIEQTKHPMCDGKGLWRKSRSPRAN